MISLPAFSLTNFMPAFHGPELNHEIDQKRGNGRIIHLKANFHFNTQILQLQKSESKVYTYSRRCGRSLHYEYWEMGGV